jgi:tetratricopeptide (TPR) repeat protein
LNLSRSVDNPHAIATYHTAIAEVIGKQAQYSKAEEHLVEARKGFEDLGDRGGVAQALAVGGIISAQKGNYEEARQLWEESLSIRRELGESARIASMLGNLGIVARHQ